MKWVKLEQNLVSKGNAISFICQGEGSNGYCNYFDIDTVQTTSNTLAYNPKLNKFNALFLVTLLDLERPKWSFGRGRSPKLGETKIKLPINSQNEIDWQYMEDYVKALREREREYASCFKNNFAQIPQSWFFLLDKIPNQTIL